MEQSTASADVLYQCRVIVNPKSSFSLGPSCTLMVTRDGLCFESNPPLHIPFGTIRSARVHQLTDGIIEHGDQKTLFRGTSIWTGASEAPKIIQVVNRIQREGPAALSEKEAKKQFGALENYWAFLVVAVAVGSSGGAVGGLWGGVFGSLAQMIINQKPQRSLVFKIVACVVAILGAFIASIITVLLLAQVFPGLIKRG